MEQLHASDNWPPTGWVDQGQWLGGFEPDAIATTTVQIAEACLGLGPHAHSHPEIYAQLLAPESIEPEWVRVAIPQMSCCAMLGRAIVRALGVVHHLLDSPYKIGLAAADLCTIALDCNVWYGHDTLPQRGDIVLIGTDPGPNIEWGSPGHVLTVTSIDGRIVRSIDGGRGVVHRTGRAMQSFDDGTLWLEHRRIFGLLRTGELGPRIERAWCLPKRCVVRSCG